MVSSETNSSKSANDTHQVLGLAVGLGVGIPVALVIVVMWFVTMRHRRMAREEDERHKAIDLDAEISVGEEKERRHRPVPGSTTYLAKQHAASQRSLNASTSNHNLIAPPNARNENTLSMVSHDTDREDLIYTPYLHEKQNTGSLENLTRDLNNLDAPKYPKVHGLRSSGSSGSLSLSREEWSRRNSYSDAPSIDSRVGSSVQNSPLPDRKKSKGHAAVLQLYDQYQPRFEENGSRLPNTLPEEEEGKKSPFDDVDNSDAFSFDDHRKSRQLGAKNGLGKTVEADETFELEDADNSGDEYKTYEARQPVANLPQAISTRETVVDSQKKRTSFVNNTTNSSNDDSYTSAHPEDPLVARRSESPKYVDAIDTSADAPVPVPPQHKKDWSDKSLPDKPLPAQPHEITQQPEPPIVQSQLPANAQFNESMTENDTTLSIDNSSHHIANGSYLGVQQEDHRPASSIYELPTATSPNPTQYNHRPSGRAPQSSQSDDWKPVTPQMQDKGFDYHLESSPLSPSSPLHSVPSFTGISRMSGGGSNAGSRRGSMSEYMPDVPYINQGIPGSPGSPRHRKRNGVGAPHMAASQSTMDSSVFLEKPSKFNKKYGGKQNKIPSASQMTL